MTRKLIVAGICMWMTVRRWRDVRNVRRSARPASAEPSPPGETGPHLVVLLPLYEEAPLVEELLSHFAQMTSTNGLVRRVVVTTAKGADTKTPLAVRAALETCPGEFEHVHYDRPHVYRADQLNFAVEETTKDLDPERTYIGVYNADSRPDVGTFDALSRQALDERHATGHFPAAFQQMVRYVVPDRSAQRRLLVGFAAYQTFWTHSRYRAGLDRLASDRRAWRWIGAPSTFLGHGEFIRLSALRDSGMFPNYAYADGLLMGWELVMSGFPIRELRGVWDRAEVPPNVAEVVRQHRAWLVGMANITHVSDPGGGLRQRLLRTTYNAVQYCQMGAWATRSIVAVSAVVLASRAGSRWRIATTLVVAGHIEVPLLTLAAHDGLWPRDDDSSPARLVSLAVAPVAYVIDGAFGFFAMVVARLTRSSAVMNPPKTARSAR